MIVVNFVVLDFTLISGEVDGTVVVIVVWIIGVRPCTE